MSLRQAPALPAAFRRIRLERAREPGHPEGDSRIGYTLLAPLTPDGYLDVEIAHDFRDQCTVTRFRAGFDSEEGHLRRRPGGSWAFHYQLQGRDDDDPGFKLGAHRFAPGEYLTIKEDEGVHTYRVASVHEL